MSFPNLGFFLSSFVYSLSSISIFHIMHYTPYRDLQLKIFPNYLKVRKLPLNGGMSCPNLDGTKGFSGAATATTAVLARYTTRRRFPSRNS